MLDAHTHLRDANQYEKETIKHGFFVAYKAGLDGVIEMPNTDPALTYMNHINDRIYAGKVAIKELDLEGKFFHGILAGLTDGPLQIQEVVDTYYELPEVVGLKMFAGHSTGNMGLITKDQQRTVYRNLIKFNYDGVLAVHCEKESLLNPELWNPKEPFSHTLARPAEAEVQSVKDQVELAAEAGFKGTLHICHVSIPGVLNYIEKKRGFFDFRITTEITPHHALLYDEMMKDDILLKMNPLLRSKKSQELMLDALMSGRIDIIATDHAPHTIEDKITGRLVDGKWGGYASGIPGLPFYPRFIKYLREKGMHNKIIGDITHSNVIDIFGLDHIPNSYRAGKQTEEELKELAEEYEFDAFRNFQ